MLECKIAPVLFNILFFIYSLVYFPYLILTGRWYKGYACRLGIFPSKLRNRLGECCTIWIHAVSVGEVMAVAGLIDQISARWPDKKVVLTTTTKTGYELAAAKLGGRVVVVPSPLDFTWVVAGFVRLIKPKIYIVAETEIWPNLFNCLHKNSVPVMIINGRISDVSFGRYKAIKGVLKNMLGQVLLFCMQSDLDSGRIKELGAPPERVKTLGNIKFDNLAMENNSQLPELSQYPLWIVGSSHPGEEEIILQTFLQHRASWRLVLAPRHVERTAEIESLIASHGFKPLRFSQLKGQDFNQDTVLVIDTIGHLRQLYKQASLVFVGKSLCGGGGQNIIEPAFCAKPIIVGPLMQNFRDITALFKSKDAVVQVKDVQEFQEQVSLLMKDENFRRQLGQRAFEVVKANQGASNRILEVLETWL